VTRAALFNFCPAVPETLGFFFVIDLIELSADIVCSLFNQGTVAMNIDMKVLVELNDTFEYSRLSLHCRS